MTMFHIILDSYICDKVGVFWHHASLPGYCNAWSFSHNNLGPIGAWEGRVLFTSCDPRAPRPHLREEIETEG